MSHVLTTRCQKCQINKLWQSKEFVDNFIENPCDSEILYCQKCHDRTLQDISLTPTGTLIVTEDQTP